MTDDEFKTFVVEKLGELSQGQEKTAVQLDAVVARFDDQDHAIDQIEAKLDRLQIAVNGAVEASAQALTAIPASVAG